jgi:uncharacterized protein YutE (UPF0331/DUF86 family)
VSPARISQRIVVERLEWIERMLREIKELPLDNQDAFFNDNRNLWTAESCLRRALEALLDLGRHLLAKGFTIAAAEYKEIAVRLRDVGVLSEEDAALLRKLAGYRNRLVHLYSFVRVDYSRWESTTSSKPGRGVCNTAVASPTSIRQSSGHSGPDNPKRKLSRS